MKEKSPLELFCNGIGCQLHSRCRRYVDGTKIDQSISGYGWMTSCDEEERPAYMPLTHH